MCVCQYIYICINTCISPFEKTIAKILRFLEMLSSPRSLPEVSRNLPVGLCEAKARCDAAASREGDILQGSWLAKNRGIFANQTLGVPSGKLT